MKKPERSQKHHLKDDAVRFGHTLHTAHHIFTFVSIVDLQQVFVC